MVSILERFIRGVRGIFRERVRETVDEIEGLTEFPERQVISGPQGFVGPGEEITSQEFTRKFVSGLFYCGGKKVQFFGLTFEQNDTDRADDLLDAIEEFSGNRCSDIRENFGYEERSGFDSSEVRIGQFWPDIEVGEL